MKTLVFRNTSNTLRVEYKVDLISNDSDNFTVMEVVGLDDAEERFGLQFSQINNDLTTFKQFAIDNNLILESIPGSPAQGGAIVTEVGPPTALDINESGAQAAGSVAVAEVVDLVMRADVGGDLNNKFFIIFSPENEPDNIVENQTAYYVWFNVDGNGVDPDPVIAGSGGKTTGLGVPISSGDTAAAVAIAAEAVIGAVSDDFNSSVATDTITVTMVIKSAIANALDGDIGGAFSATVTTPGVDNAYDEILTAAGGVGKLTWTVTSGALPAGLTLGSTTGKITGNPQTVENPTFEATVTDEFGEKNVQAGLSINIA